MRSDTWIYPTGKGVVSLAAQRAVRKELLNVAWQLREVMSANDRLSERYARLQSVSFHALAVLRLFRELFPELPWHKMVRRVIRIERHASRWLELELLRGQLLEYRRELTLPSERGGPTEPSREQREGVDMALDRIREQQQEVRAAQGRVLMDWEQKQIEQHCTAFSQHASWRQGAQEPSFAVAACRYLAQALDTLRQSIEYDVSEVTMLHDMRQTLQQADVLLDIFGGLQDAPSVVALRDELRDTVQHLESVLRHSISLSWLMRWEHDAGAKRERKALHALGEWQQRRSPADFAQFQQWWADGHAKRVLDESATYIAKIEPLLTRGAV